MSARHRSRRRQEAPSPAPGRTRGQRGASSVEYALIVALLAAVTAGSLTLLEGVLSAEYTDTCEQVASYEGGSC